MNFPPPPGTLHERFGKDGFVVVSSGLKSATIDAVIADFRRLVAAEGSLHSVRGALAKRPAAREAAKALVSLAALLLGTAGDGGRATECRATKGTFFDKTEEANWLVPWHQDLTITVNREHALPGFSHWRQKEGLWHTQPPLPVLERIVALRLHLDDCPETHGALRVVPGSHRRGILSTEETTRVAREPAVTVPAERGQILAVSPLILHSSGRSESPTHRRVLHIEYSDARLPAPLEWSA